MVGVDDEASVLWLRSRLLAQTPLKCAIADIDCPLMFAMKLSKTCNLPTPGYLMRSMPYRVTAAVIADLAEEHMSVLQRRFAMPSPLPHSAAISLEQPKRNGGLGFRSVAVVLPAAKWAAAATVAADVQRFVDIANPAPFVIDRNICHRILAENGVAVDCDERVPSRLEAFFQALSDLGSRAANLLANIDQKVSCNDSAPDAQLPVVTAPPTHPFSLKNAPKF